jgi:hypothetical protein
VGRLERALDLAVRSRKAPEDAALAREAAEARRDAIEVDSFTLDEYLGLTAAAEATEAVIAATA